MIWHWSSDSGHSTGAAARVYHSKMFAGRDLGFSSSMQDMQIGMGLHCGDNGLTPAITAVLALLSGSVTLMLRQRMDVHVGWERVVESTKTLKNLVGAVFVVIWYVLCDDILHLVTQLAHECMW